MTGDITPVLEHVDTDLDQSVDRLFSLVRIESISTDPAYAQACLDAAAWLSDDLNRMGFEASVRETPGHPMVVGHYTPPGGADVPHVLFYGHYDVQPVDPLDLWEKPPFEPHIAEAPDGTKQLIGRGTSDDKGQLMTFLEACRAHIAIHGALPLRVTVLLEGEEESGSESLDPFLEANADELRADVALVCDTGMWDAKTPAITTMLRGLLGVEIMVTGPKIDLHSGMYGGAARNPIRILNRILSDLHDDDGRVQVPGFYDGVVEMPEAVQQQWKNLDFDESEFLGEIGLEYPCRRNGPQCPGADLVAADLRSERHHRWLHRRRHQDRDPVEGRCKDILPAGWHAGPICHSRGFREVCHRTRSGRLFGRVHRSWRWSSDRDRHR